MVLLDGVAYFHHEPHAGAQPGTHQMLTHRAEGEQRGNGRAVGADLAVADDEQAGALAGGHFGAAAQRIECRLQRLRARAGVVRGVEGGAGELREIAEGGHLLRQQHRVFDAQHARVAGLLHQRGATAPEVHAQRHHHALA